MRSRICGTRTSANCYEMTPGGGWRSIEPRLENGCRRPARNARKRMEKMESEPARPKKTQEDKRSRDPRRWIRRAIEKYRKRKIAPPLHPDSEFFVLADEVVKNDRTLLG